MKINIRKTKELLKEELIAICEEYYNKYGTRSITRSYYRKRTKYGNVFENLFGGWNNFIKTYIKPEPKATQRVDQTIAINAKGNKRFIVSSVVEGADYSLDFFNSLKHYCKKNDAQLILLWSRGISKKDAFSDEDLELFKPYLATEVSFNSKLKSFDFMLFPTQILPLTGLGRFGAKDTSLIIASTKQHMESIPRPAGKVPHTLWSTGTISLPNYPKTRAGSLARQDNVLGALIVEVEDNKRFYIRPVQYIDDGFVDLGIKYISNDSYPVKATAMVWGDLHLGEESDFAVKASIEQAKELKARNIVIHDIVSLNSINHHNKSKYLTKAVFYKNNFSSLEKEMAYATWKFKDIRESFKKDIPHFYVVHSNHDNFIKTYLEEGDFVKDTPNAIFAAQLFIELCKDENPLVRIADKAKNVTFLPEDAFLLFEGINVGLHGSEKSNGGKTNVKTFGRTHDKIVIGHSHSPCIFLGAYQVGTLSGLQLGYNTGSSSWMHANCVIYEGGYRQLITFLDKKWKLSI